MRFVTFEQAGEIFLGALTADDAIQNLTEASRAAARGDTAAFQTMRALIDGGEGALDEARRLMDVEGHAVAADAVRLLAPLPRPQSIRDFFTFPGHILQSAAGMQRLRARIAGEPAPNAPPFTELPPLYRQKAIYHKCNPLTVVGTGVDVIWPRYSDYMDFELELAVVIGRRGVDIAAKDAAQHIFGYTIFNDFSARDAQMEEMPGMMGPAKGKDFDRGNVIGPCIATADEFDDVHDIAMRAYINGEPFAEGSNSEMLHSFEEIIAYISRGETLHPGELLGSGTMSGGCGIEQDHFLSDGDLVTLEIEGIGRIENRVRRA